MIAARILGTKWAKWPDGLWRASGDRRRVAASFGGAVQCEMALVHAAKCGLRAPCNDGHIWTDKGRITAFDAAVKIEMFGLTGGKRRRV